jgi:chromosome segregation ATPase
VQFKSVVSLLTITDNHTERLIAAALGADVLHTVVVPTDAAALAVIQQRELPGRAPAVVSEEVIERENPIEAGNLQQAAAAAGAVYAYTCFNEQTSKLPYNLLCDTLLVQSLDLALQLREHTDFRDHVPNMVTHDGFYVHENGHIRDLAISGIDSKTVSELPTAPYFACSAAANKGKGKAKSTTTDAGGGGNSNSSSSSSSSSSSLKRARTL